MRSEPRTSFGYMPFYFGDYDADTGHLSTLEHGVYFLLIKAYWKSSRALPDNDPKLANLAQLPLNEWRMMRTTVAEFFVIQDGFWFHKRIEKELAHFRDKSEKARKSREIGLRKAKEAAKQSDDNSLFASEDQRTLNERSTIGGRSTSVAVKNPSQFDKLNGISEHTNGRLTDVERPINYSDSYSDTTTEYSGSIEVLSRTEKNGTQHQSINGAFLEVVGRSMKKIDVECLARLQQKYSDPQIEAGIYVAGIRALSLGKKPVSLAYFENEIAKIDSSEIQDLGQYTTYLRKKLAGAKANGACA